MHAAVTAGDIQAKFEDANLDESLGGAPEDQDVQIPAPANRQDAHPEISAKIVRQVNFYFSDTNLPTDHFLLREVNKTSEGWGAHAAVNHKPGPQVSEC